MTEEKKKPLKKKSVMRRPTQGVAFTVWSQNGTAVPDEVVTKLEYALQSVILEQLGEGHRLLTQTTRA